MESSLGFRSLIGVRRNRSCGSGRGPLLTDGLSFSVMVFSRRRFPGHGRSPRLTGIFSRLFGCGRGRGPVLARQRCLGLRLVPGSPAWVFAVSVLVVKDGEDVTLSSRYFSVVLFVSLELDLVVVVDNLSCIVVTGDPSCDFSPVWAMMVFPVCGSTVSGGGTINSRPSVRFWKVGVRCYILDLRERWRIRRAQG